MCFAGSNAAGQARQQQQQQEQQVAQATNQINQAFAGYNPAFFSNYTQQYENSAMPNLYDQYQQTQKQLGYQLANQGLLNSSAAGQDTKALNTELGLQKQGVANQALGATNTLRQNVAQEQQNLIGQANAATSPASVAQQALGAASSFSSPSMAQPVAGLFQNFANMYLGNKVANTYGQQYPYGFGSPAWMNLGSSLPTTIGGQ